MLSLGKKSHKRSRSLLVLLSDSFDLYMHTVHVTKTRGINSYKLDLELLKKKSEMFVHIVFFFFFSEARC